MQHKNNLPIKLFQVKQKSYSLVVKLFNLVLRIAYKKPVTKIEHRLPDVIPLLDASPQENYKYLTFTFSFIALAAQLIEIDQQATETEILALISCFPVAPNHEQKIRNAFANACNDPASDIKYAYKIIELFHNKKLYHQLLTNLTKIALADGYLSQPESLWLQQIASIFGFERKIIWQLAKSQLSYDTNPYVLLKIDKKYNMAMSRKSFYCLWRQNFMLLMRLISY